MIDCDVAIIGGGPGGYVAAIRAAQLGLNTVCVEMDKTLGGTCVNVGCIPSKALLAAAEQRHRAGAQRFPGIRTDAGLVDMAALVAGKDEIVGALRQEKYLDLADRHAIELVHDDARFVEGAALDVDGRTIVAAAYLVATGSTPRIPDIPGLADSRYLTSTTAMDLDALPASLIVLGGGYVALEQAQLFAHLGTTVTILARSSIARREEPEIAEALRGALLADGIRVLEQTDVQSVRRDGTQVTVLTGAGELSAGHLLVATGRRPQSDGLGLNAAGVLTDEDGAVLVDAELRTSNPKVWAAGDVTGHPQFVYVAARHGKMVVESAFDAAARSVDYTALPRITFTNPTIASAGLTEAEARAKGLAVHSRVLELSAVPRAIVSRATHGLVKLVCEQDSGRIVGVHLLADGAGDAILAGVYAIQSQMTVAQMADSWNPYLTIGEAVHLAAQSFTRDPATLSCCA